MPLLEVQNVSKLLSGGLEIKNISFKQEHLQKIAIAGVSGAGKTTLLKMIAGLAQADSGSILFDGKKIIGPLDKLLPGHPQIAYLSQHYELLNNYRVEELIWFENKLTTAEAAAIFEICRISDLLQRRTDQLSGGEKQRIALCMLLVKSPRLLVLDEPFSNLDPIHTNTLKQVLDDVAERLQITCLLTSHDPDDTLPWADEILVMQDGQIVQQGSPEEIYYQPENEYVAGMFGNYNLIKPEHVELFLNTKGLAVQGKSMIVRPEHLSISTVEGVKGIVGKTTFRGGYYDVEIVVNEITIVSRTKQSNWKKGDEVFIKMEQGKEWFL